ncbi:MAG: nucleoside 2-deoxyribosyltransferase domain-containing protein [Alphaproteobacteria bacterium]|nr:nucleoside 2-deoxyribosyltransferase domain-containing protein [Alphaproteobacteria bacterium]
MKIFSSEGEYDLNPAFPSVFLAGPTLRGADKAKYPNWRRQAVRLFSDAKYCGALYSPDPFAPTKHEQIDWEVYHLEKSTCIMFWIPRDLEVLPGFTTNVEFGEWMRSGKTVLGFPSGARKMTYLEYRAEKYDVPVSNTLKDTVCNAMRLCSRAGR